MRKNGCLFLLLLVLFALLTACTDKEPGEEQAANAVNIYYLNKDATTLVTVSHNLVGENEDAIIQELLTKMMEIPEDIEMRPPLGMGFSVLECYVEGTQLVINVDEHYREMSPTDEILVRAALVRTMVQVQGVDCVNILVRGEPLTDTNGNPIGVMKAETFIDNEGSEINSYEQANIRLFFANEDGTGLVEISKQVVYNSNISMEKLVLEQLIAGPGNSECYPTINPDTKIVSVVVTDGVCYVNLSSEFLTQPYNVSAEVTIYSIVNSMVELSNVNKVQIAIQGDNTIIYREVFPLENIYERNLDLVIE